MPTRKKFTPRREFVKGEQHVDAGFKGGDLTFRLHHPDGRNIHLTYDEAYDLADVLDQALDSQEANPLL